MIRRENFKRFLCVAFWLAMIVFAFGRIGHAADQTYYVTQSGAGAKTGADLANAWAITDLESAGNWSATESASAIDPGDTVYLSGDISLATIDIPENVGGTSSAQVTLDGWEAGTCDPRNTTCTSAANITGYFLLNSSDYITFRDLDFQSGSQAIVTTNAVLSTGLQIRDSHFARYTTAGINLAIVHDTIIDNNKFVAGVTDGTGQNITIRGGKRNVISNNYINGGKTGIIFKYGRTSNGGGNAGVIEDNIVTDNVIVTTREEGLSFDFVGGDPDAVGAFEYDIVSSSATHTVTLSNANWGGGDDWSLVGYDMMFLSGALSGKSLTITNQSNATFTFAEDVSSAASGDRISICAPFKNNYVANNTLAANFDPAAFLIFGAAVGNVIENNTTTSDGALSSRSLRDTVSATGSVTGECGMAPAFHNLFYNNTSDDDINVWLRDLSDCTSSIPNFVSTGGTVISNTIGDRLYVDNVDYYAASNTGTVYNGGNTENNAAYKYDRPYIVGTPTIGTDGVTVSITWSETVDLTAYTDGDLYLVADGERVNLTSPTGTGAARTFTTAATILELYNCVLWYNGDDTAIINSASMPMTVVGNKVITNNSIQSTEYPNATITSPVGNQTIEEGESLTFTSDVTCTTNTPCTYLWNFDGGAVNSTSEDAGATAFATAGVYNVTLTVTDAASVADPTPAQVTVTVRAATGANNYTGNTNVKGLWVFENNLNDTSGNSNNLTGSGSPAYDSSTEIEGDYSLDLEAESSQFASIADASLASGFTFKGDTTEAPWTLLAKFKLESLPTAGARMIIASKYGYTANLRSFYLGVENVDGTTYPTFAIGYADGVSNDPEFHGSAVTAGVNYAIVLVFNNATDEYTFALYNLDTAAVVGTNATGDLTSTVNGGWCNTAASFDIGKIGPNNTYYFDGLIDEVVVLSQEFSTTEISAYFAGNYSVSTAEIVRIYSSTPTAYYKEGDTTAPFFVEFADAISWSVGAGSIKLTLVNDTGDDVAVDATSASGSGSTIEFDGLVVPDGFNTADLDAVTLAAAGGATIKVSGTTTDADLTVPTDPDSRSLDRNGRIVIDDTVDTITSVVGVSDDASSFTDPDGYIDIAVNLPSTDGYHVGYTTAWPKVGLAVGDETLYAEYVGKTDANTLVFRLALSPGNRDSDGIAIAGNLVLTGATLTDMAGNTVSLTMPASPNTLADDSTYVVAVPKNLATATAWWVGTGFDAATFDLLDLVDGDRILIAE